MNEVLSYEISMFSNKVVYVAQVLGPRARAQGPGPRAQGPGPQVGGRKFSKKCQNQKGAQRKSLQKDVFNSSPSFF